MDDAGGGVEGGLVGVGLGIKVEDGFGVVGIDVVGKDLFQLHDGIVRGCGEPFEAVLGSPAMPAIETSNWFWAVLSLARRWLLGACFKR